MPQQKGSTAKIMIGIENVAYATAATVGYVLPVNSCNVVDSQAVQSAATLQSDRNPTEPFKGNRGAAGSIVVPIDSVCLPYWMIAAFGDPGSTGANPYVHEFKIPTAQPSFTLEKGFTDLTTDRYERLVGCKVGGFGIELGGDGELVMTLNVIGAKGTFEVASFDASPDGTPALSRIKMFHGAVLEGGSSSTIITRCSINVDFGLDTRPELIPIGASGVRASLPEGMVKVTGQVTALFDDDGYTLLNKGVADTESSLKLTFTGAASSVFELELQELKYSLVGVPVEGPQGLLVTMPFEAFYVNGSEASAIVARITNTTASYNLVT